MIAAASQGMGIGESVTLIAVAVIGAVATTITNIRSNRKTRDENTSQHGASVQAIGELTGAIHACTRTVELVDGKVDSIDRRVTTLEVHAGDRAIGGETRHLEVDVYPPGQWEHERRSSG